MAKSDKPTYRQRAKGAVEKLLDRVKPIEMGLFGLGGYYMGKVLDQTGLAQLANTKGPHWVNEWVNSGIAAGAKTPGTVFNKSAGLATFAACIADSAAHKGNLSSGVLNAALPYSLGAMFDGPGDNYSESPGAFGDGRWRT